MDGIGVAHSCRKGLRRRLLQTFGSHRAERVVVVNPNNLNIITNQGVVSNLMADSDSAWLITWGSDILVARSVEERPHGRD